MEKTITNNAPSDLMFSQPVFYRVQANFPGNAIFHFDYLYKETIDRMQDSGTVAVFKIRPKYAAQLDNSLYELQSV